MRGISQRRQDHRRRAAQFGVALLLGVALALFAVAAPASAHAYPIRMEPASKALLQGPPSGVIITFNENINPAASRITVVDPTNRQVDNRDSQVSTNNSHQLSVTLPLLKSGTYIVVWKVQSADDGHVTGSSYYFQIAKPDGSPPPLPAQLPTGNTPGAGGTSADSAALDGPSILQAICTWLALLLLTFWVGGVLWETWILPPTAADPDLAATAHAAAARFRRLTPITLGPLLLANVGIVLAQSAALAGDWSGLASPQYLRAILFSTHFGFYWWLRELLALAALTLLQLSAQRGWAYTKPIPPVDAVETQHPAQSTTAAIPDWRRELVATLGDIRHLPARLAEGIRARAPLGRIELALAVLLLLAFALSGHAAAVAPNIFAYAIAVDLLHLLGDALWLGGLFYIGLVLVPALRGLPLARRARVLALGLPHFGAVAILSAAVLALTGSLNATIRMTSFAQLLTTTYGRTLAVKIELFLIMAAISAYHAFLVRPRLAAALATSAERPEQSLVAATPIRAPATSAHAEGSSRSDEPSPSVESAEQTPKGGMRSLAERLEDWLRREAILGIGVLLCATLLGAYAGTLATAPAAASPDPGSSGPFIKTQQAGALAVTLKVTPATFGANTFYVTIKDERGNPVNGATVLAQSTMLDMDMGTQNISLAPVGADAPGSYAAQGDLTMAGHWGLVVKVLPPDKNDFVSTTFDFAIGY